MSYFRQSFVSGKRFEDEIYEVLKENSKDVWRNVRVETLLTSTGFSEIDLLCCYKGIVMTIEAKNISRVQGDYCDYDWTLTGFSDNGQSYRKLSVFTQNNIHIRSLQDAYYLRYNEWLNIVPIIVVPDSCEIDERLKAGIFNLFDLRKFFYSNGVPDGSSTVQRALAAMIDTDGNKILRSDFIFDRALGKRVHKNAMS